MNNRRIKRQAGVLIPDEVMSAEDQAKRQLEWNRRYAENEARRTAAEEAGLPALHRLVEVAKRGTGQSRICGRFLLALYNSRTFPFDMSDLRSLDQALWEDCMSVLRLDQRPRDEVHNLVDNGFTIWEELKAVWGKKIHT